MLGGILLEVEEIWRRGKVYGGRMSVEVEGGWRRGESGGGVHVGICRGRLKYEGILVEGVIWPEDKLVKRRISEKGSLVKRGGERG